MSNCFVESIDRRFGRYYQYSVLCSREHAPLSIFLSTISQHNDGTGTLLLLFVILVDVLQVVDDVLSVPLLDFPPRVLESLHLSPAVSAPALALEVGAQLPFGGLVIPREFFALGYGPDRPEVEDGRIVVITTGNSIVVANTAVRVSDSDVRGTRMVDENGRKIHHYVGVPIPLDCISISDGRRSSGPGGHDPFTCFKVAGGKHAQAFAVGGFCDLNDPLVILVAQLVVLWIYEVIIFNVIFCTQ